MIVPSGTGMNRRTPGTSAQVAEPCRRGGRSFFEQITCRPGGRPAAAGQKGWSMKKVLVIVVGVVVTAAGGVWALQGWGVIGGSFMSGSSTWAIVGPVIAIAGLVLIAVGLRRRTPAR